MAPPNLIPLDKAVLCANCNCVSDSPGPCLGCESVAVMSLARILNREIDEVPEGDINDLLRMVEETLTRHA